MEFSEFSYGHAVTGEIEQRLRSMGITLLAAPQLPNLREERKLGYDVRIDSASLVVVLQFKLGEYVSRRHASSITWPHARRAHYRTSFPAAHHQLPALQSLERHLEDSTVPSIVSYIAPAFYRLDEFSRHYAAANVTQHSYSCRPSEVPEDDLAHHLVYAPPSAHTPESFFVLSEPAQVKPEDIAKTISETVATGLATKPESDNEAFLVPHTVSTVLDWLFAHAESHRLERGAINALLERSERDFPERPDLAAAGAAITLGEFLGLPIGFTARVS